MSKIIGIIVGVLVFAGAFWYFTKVDNEKRESAKNGEQLESQTSNPLTSNSDTNNKIMNAILHTNKGDITIEFDTVNTPNTVANFIKLAQSGFYDGTKFHRVIKDFMNQGGDPLSKDDSRMAEWGTGGPGYSFSDEITPSNSNEVGTIAMANSGPNTNGSQFFINVKNNSFLNGKHTAFGRITSGLDVVMAINGVKTGAGDRPIEPVIIESVTLK
jgi:peptidylprolyl isomerase